MELKQLEEKEFTAFATSHHYENYLQCVEFAHMKQAEGWKTYLLGGVVAGEIVAASLITATPVFAGYSCCLAPKGFLMDYHNKEQVKQFSQLVCDFLKKEKGLYLRIDPELLYQEHDQNGNVVEGGFCNQDCVDYLCEAGFRHEGFFKGISANSHVRYTFVTPLENEDEKSLLKKMSKLTQRSIKNTDKYHIRVERITSKEDLDVYVNLISETAKRRHFEVFDKEFYEKQWDFYGDKIWFLCASFYVREYMDTLRIQLAVEEHKLSAYMEDLTEKQLKKKKQHEDTIAVLKKNIADAMVVIEKAGDVVPLSAASFVLMQDEIIYFNGGSDERYMKYCGQYALQWHMIKEGLARGHKQYNFNGLSGIFDESADDYGVFTFKRGFGGHIEEYVGYFNVSLHPLIQKVYGLCRRLKLVKG